MTRSECSTEDYIAPSRCLVELAPRGAIVAVVREDASLLVEDVGPIDVVASRVEDDKPLARGAIAAISKATEVADGEEVMDGIVCRRASCPASIHRVNYKIRIAEIFEGHFSIRHSRTLSPGACPRNAATCTGEDHLRGRLGQG